MRNILVLLILNLPFTLIAQKVTYNVGTGYTFFGSGDNIIFRFENSINYQPKESLKLTASYAMGSAEQWTRKSDPFYANLQNTFKEIAICVGLSPFSKKEVRKSYFGAGVYYLDYVNLVRSGYSMLPPPSDPLGPATIKVYTQQIDKTISVGAGLFYDHMSSSSFLGERVMLGFKLSVQYYVSADLNYTAMLKMGLKL